MNLTGNFYWHFHCKGCGNLLVIPVDTLVPPSSNRETLSKETRYAVAVCPHCKLAKLYSGDKDSPAFDPSMTVVSGIQTESLVRAIWLECEGGDLCHTPIGLYVKAKFPIAAEETATWKWGDIECPNGNVFRLPRK